jgi:hypothetical protein
LTHRRDFGAEFIEKAAVIYASDGIIILFGSFCVRETVGAFEAKSGKI